jgi:tetratricopeptide (TPR) repeat protein
MKTTRSFLAATVAAVLAVTSHAGSTPVEDALALLKQGDVAAAEAIVAPLAEDKSNAAALDALAQVRIAQKRSKEAIELAQLATQLEPKNAAYFARLGVACSSRMPELAFMQQAALAGRMRKAFETAVELDPGNLAALVGLSRYYSSAPEIAGGSFEKAEQFATRAQAVNRFVGTLELARLAERAGQKDSALTHYRAALALQPAHAPTQEAIARLEGRQ